MKRPKIAPANRRLQTRVLTEIRFSSVDGSLRSVLAYSYRCNLSMAIRIEKTKNLAPDARTGENLVKGVAPERSSFIDRARRRSGSAGRMSGGAVGEGNVYCQRLGTLRRRRHREGRGGRHRRQQSTELRGSDRY
jgi:hypothetical protein